MSYELPAAFEEFAAGRQAGFLRVKERKEQGGKVAGTFCAFTPVELLDAAGFLAASLCGMSNETIPIAETELPKNICPLVKSSYGFYLSDKCPYTYFADLIVGETTCDAKKKMYEMLGKGKNVYTLHLPQGIKAPYAKEQWISELHRFHDYLEEAFGVTITDDDLRKAAERRNEFRAARARMLNLLSADVPPVSGTELYAFLDGLGFVFDLDEAIKKVNDLADEMSKHVSDKVTPGGKRILVTGCPIGGVYKKAVGAIEANGANVVCYENCGGIKPLRNSVDLSNPDIYDALAEYYLHIGCSVMTPNEERLKMYPELFKEFKVDAVLDLDLQACHTYIIEGYTIKQLCKDYGVPYMQLETDYSEADAGQISTRIAAFLETLED